MHFGTMLFHTNNFYGSGTPETMAIVLRTICQGMKVCVEIVLMAAGKSPSVLCTGPWREHHPAYVM